MRARVPPVWIPMLLVVAFSRAIEVPSLFAQRLFKPACHKCRVELGPPTNLLGTDSTGLVSWPRALRIDGWSRLLVVESGVDARVLVYELPGGRVRQVGRRGSGPGEFIDPSLLALFDGDSIAVYDQGLRRLSIFDPNLRFVRSAPMPAGAFDVRWHRHSKSFLVNAAVPDRARAGIPFHFFDRVGNQLTSFGTERQVNAGSLPELTERTIELPDGGLLSTPAIRYQRLEWWAPNRQRVRVAVRPTAFPPRDYSVDSLLKSQPMPTQVMGMWLQGPDLLWVVLWVPDLRWRQAFVRRFDSSGETRFDLVDYERAFDTVVELIDLKAMALKSTTRFDQPFLVGPEANTLIQLRNNAADLYVLEKRSVVLISR